MKGTYNEIHYSITTERQQADYRTTRTSISQTIIQPCEVNVIKQNKTSIADKYRRTWPVITQYTNQYTQKSNTKRYQIELSKQTNIQHFYAAAQVAARPIARQRPAIIVIAFLFCTAMAIAPLKSLAIMLWGHRCYGTNDTHILIVDYVIYDTICLVYNSSNYSEEATNILNVDRWMPC